MWGLNSEYQLGDGSTTNRLLPEPSSGPNRAWRVAKPRFDPSGGAGSYYNTELSIVVTVDTPGATIHYTRDGEEPTQADAFVASGATVLVDASQVLKAKAWKSGMPPSGSSRADFVMKLATPVLSPPGGSFSAPQNVTISTTTPGATLRYTTNGSLPTESSPVYTGPVTLGGTGYLWAMGFRPGWEPSDLGGAYFTFSFGPLPLPVATPGAGTQEGPLSVALSSVPGATIYYTTNGSAPTTASPIYTEPLVLTSSTTIKAKAYHPDYTPSPMLTQTYTIRMAQPVFSIAAGTHAPSTIVTITLVDPAGTIRYTLSGLDPTSTDPIFVPGHALLVGEFTLKAKAFKTGALESAVVASTYTLTEPLGGGVLAAGGSHTVLSTPGGLLYGFGQNTSGQVGDGTSTNRTTPKLVHTLTGVTALAAGQSHTLAATWDGRVFAWGSNGSGRLGDGTTTNRTSPVHISTLSNVVAVAAGNGHSLALTADGLVYAWGVGTNGQLGLGWTGTTSTPTQVTLMNVVAIAAGGTHSLAVTSDGQLYAWGLNSSFQLGDGTNVQKTSPTLVSTLTNVMAIAAGGSHSLARVESGAVYAWGAGSSGELGLGTTNNRSTPQLVPALTATDITAGVAYSAAVRDDGVTVMWGANASGQLGDTTNTQRLVPTIAADASALALLAAGGTHVAEVTPDGHLWTWGAGSTGQLGDGTTSARATPADVGTLPGAWGTTSTPTVSPAPGPYHEVQTVIVSMSMPGATVRYTTTGVPPTDADAEVPVSGQITIDATTTLSLRAWVPGRAPSRTVSGTYTLQPLPPTIAPAGGSFTEAQVVTLSTTTPGSTIRYTTDGSVPLATSPPYNGPLTIDTARTLTAAVFKTGWSTSDVSAATFTLTLAPPTFAPPPGSYQGQLEVTLFGPAGAELRYTSDGSNPTEVSSLYSAPFTVPNGQTTLKARAFRSGWASSEIAAGSYVVNGPPTVTARAYPKATAAGWHHTPVTVTFQCDDATGIQTCPQPVLVSTEGAGQVVSGTATNTAGMSATASVTLNLDFTPPALTITSQVPSGSPTSETTAEINLSVADALSSVAFARCNGNAVPVAGGTFTCEAPLRKGRNLILIDAIDEAGNSRSLSVELERVAPAAGLVVAPTRLLMLVGDRRPVQVRDDSGRPVTGLVWTSENASIAEVEAIADDGTIVANAPGEVELTVSAGALTETLQVVVAEGTAVGVGSSVWEVAPLPGYGVQSVVDGARDALGPTVLSLEVAATANAVVRALGPDGSTKWLANVPWHAAGYGSAKLIGSGRGGALLVGGDSVTYLPTPGDGPAWHQQVSGSVAADGGYHVAQGPDGDVVVVGSPYGSMEVIGIDGETGQVKWRLVAPRVPGSSSLNMDCSDSLDYIGEEHSAGLSRPVIDEEGTAFLFVQKDWSFRDSNPDGQCQTIHAEGSGSLELLHITSSGSSSYTPLHSYTYQYAYSRQEPSPDPYWVTAAGVSLTPAAGGGVLVAHRLSAWGSWPDTVVTGYGAASGVALDLPDTQVQGIAIGEDGLALVNTRPYGQTNGGQTLLLDQSSGAVVGSLPFAGVIALEGNDVLGVGSQLERRTSTNDLVASADYWTFAYSRPVSGALWVKISASGGIEGQLGLEASRADSPYPLSDGVGGTRGVGPAPLRNFSASPVVVKLEGCETAFKPVKAAPGAGRSMYFYRWIDGVMPGTVTGWNAGDWMKVPDWSLVNVEANGAEPTVYGPTTLGCRLDNPDPPGYENYKSCWGHKAEPQWSDPAPGGVGVTDWKYPRPTGYDCPPEPWWKIWKPR